METAISPSRAVRNPFEREAFVTWHAAGVLTGRTNAGRIPEDLRTRDGFCPSTAMFSGPGFRQGAPPPLLLTLNRPSAASSFVARAPNRTTCPPASRTASGQHAAACMPEPGIVRPQLPAVSSRTSGRAAHSGERNRPTPPSGIATLCTIRPHGYFLRTCLADGLRPPQEHFFAPLRALRRRGSRSAKQRYSPGRSPRPRWSVRGRFVHGGSCVRRTPGVRAPVDHGASLVYASHPSQTGSEAAILRDSIDLLYGLIAAAARSAAPSGAVSGCPKNTDHRARPHGVPGSRVPSNLTVSIQHTPPWLIKPTKHP